MRAPSAFLGGPEHGPESTGLGLRAGSQTVQAPAGTSDGSIVGRFGDLATPTLSWTTGDGDVGHHRRCHLAGRWFAFLVILGAMEDVSVTVYEAASIEGAP